MTGLVRGALVALILVLLPGCDPPYLSDTYTTSTPGPKSFDASELAGMPVVVLAFMAPSNLQGFSPTLSHALSGALTDVAPPIREIPTDETLNRLTDQGLATDTLIYAPALRAMECWTGSACGGLDWDLACDTCCCQGLHSSTKP